MIIRLKKRRVKKKKKLISIQDKQLNQNRIPVAQKRGIVYEKSPGVFVKA